MSHTIKFLDGTEKTFETLRGGNLSRANLRYAGLSRANLSRADLPGGDLYRANLREANLREADLSGANLSGANLGNQWIIQGPTRSDEYHFFLQKLTADSQPMIKAGCRHFTLPEAWKHWRATRSGTPLGEETFAILEYLEKVARIQGRIPT